jgi:hypothetical protein
MMQVQGTGRRKKQSPSIINQSVAWCSFLRERHELEEKLILYLPNFTFSISFVHVISNKEKECS